MKRKLVNRLFAAFLSFTMVFSDLNIPAFAAENNTVSENIVSELVSENEAEEEIEEFEVEAEEIEDLSVSEDNAEEAAEESVSEDAIESVSEDNAEEIESEEIEDASEEDEEVIAEESEDGSNGVGGDTSYADPLSSTWGKWVLGVGSSSVLKVDNIYMNIYSSSVSSKAAAVPTAGGYRMMIHGDDVTGTINLTTDIWTTIKSKPVYFRSSSGSYSKTDYTIEDFLPYIEEIGIKNMDGIDAASSIFPLCTNCTKITFCDDTKETGAKYTRTISSLSGSVFKGLAKLQSVILPSAVTSLSAEYFSGCSALTSVTGSNFTTIPNACFYNCTSLTAVPNASSITSIGADAFRGCTRLSSVPSSVTSIGNNAFYGCTALTSASLGNCSSIGSQAFRGSNIASLSLKSGCSIGDYAFYGTKITSIDVSGLTLGTGVFQQCTSLTTVTCNAFDAGQFTGAHLSTVNIKASGTLNSELRGFSSYLTTVNAPNITAIGDSIFSGCSRLSSVTFGTLTSVGSSAFSGCSAITQDKINLSGLTSIGTNAFQNTGITKVVLGSGMTSFPNAFSGCKLTSITMPGVSVIPDLTAFKSTLTEVVANNATSISDRAFNGCNLINTLTIPRVTTVGESAFLNCTKLTQSNIDISKFTSIGANAFQNTGITTVVLNSALTSFPSAFSGCKLTSVTIPGAKTLGDNSFKAFAATLTTIDAENVTSLGESAFEGCIALKSVSLPKLKTVGARAFYGCTTLTGASYSTVETIGNEAFMNCSNLSSINFENATTIGKFAFNGCEKLTTLALDKVSTIEENAFAGCPIKALALEHIITIGENAFAGCTELKSASIETATTIYNGAFSGCENLSALSLRDITLIGVDGFKDIGNKLDTQPVIAIPATKNISIGKGAFVGNLGYVTYDATEDVWNQKISLGGEGTQREVFGNAYILFKDGKKLYPEGTTPTTGTDEPTEPPTPSTDPTDPTGGTTPTSPTNPSDGSLTEEDIENLIKKIIEIVITGKPDPTDADAVQKWLDDIKEIAEKYNIDIEALITKALENIDNPTELEKVINQIIDKFKETVKDTVNTLVNTAPSSTDSKELMEWWFERVKELAKENNWTDLYNLALSALDNIDDETKRADFLAQLLALLKEKQSAVTPTPTPTPATDENEKTDPSAKYYHAIFYTYYDNAPHVYVENNIIEGGSILNIPKAEYDGYTFMGWYEIASLTTNKPARWYVGTPIYKNLALSAIFVNDKGEIKVIIPDEEFPIKGELDPANPPAPVAVTPGDGNSNNITNINFNILPSKGGLGDLSASGLDSFIDFGAITKNNTEIYMVKGQKVIDSSVNVVSGDAKIVKVKLTKNGTLITAKKDGTTTLSVTNRTSGVTYQCKVNVCTPKMSAKSITIAAGQTANATIACGSYTNKYPIYWHSSNVDVAYVEASTTHGIAVVHGIGKGSATITAYVNGKAYKTKVKVKETAKIDSVAGTIIINPMETVNIAKSGLNGMDGFNPKVATWTYGTAGIVEINDSGIMTGKAYGTTTVTGVAKDGARKQFTVKVTSASPRTLHINMGQSKKISLYKVPAKKAVFKSSNTEVATVNESGKVNAHSAGVALITANYMGYVYRYYVYVENPTLMNTSNLSGSGKKYSLGINKGGLSHLAVIYADQPVIFSSKKPEIVFVDENGFVRGRNAGVGDISTKVNKLSIKIKTTVF